MFVFKCSARANALGPKLASLPRLGAGSCRPLRHRAVRDWQASACIQRDLLFESVRDEFFDGGIAGHTAM